MNDTASTSLATRPSSLLSNGQLTKLQAISGALFSVFLLLHLSNTSLAIFGNEVYDEFQQLIQGFYQHPLLELLFVFVPLLLHAGAGITLLIRNRNRKGSIKLSQKLHSWAGFILLSAVFGHIAATRGIGFVYDAPTGFNGVAFSIWWMPAVFYPYYFTLFMAGLYHLTYGLSRVSSRLGFRASAASARLFQGILVSGATAAILALLSFGGQRYEIPDPTDNDYARAYAKLAGIDLNRDK